MYSQKYILKIFQKEYNIVEVIFEKSKKVFPQSMGCITKFVGRQASYKGLENNLR